MEWKGEVGEEGESGGDVRAVIGCIPTRTSVHPFEVPLDLENS
jgi:hypothetical protein